MQQNCADTHSIQIELNRIKWDMQNKRIDKERSRKWDKNTLLAMKCIDNKRTKKRRAGQLISCNRWQSDWKWILMLIKCSGLVKSRNLLLIARCIQCVKIFSANHSIQHINIVVRIDSRYSRRLHLACTR